MLSYLYALATDRKNGPVDRLFKAVLFGFSLIYGVFVRLFFLAAYSRRKELTLKVISVGNITLGGTGKTSLVEFIALKLQDSAHKCAILSRGYKARKANSGDEPEMLSRNLNGIEVIIGKDRVKSAQKAAAIPGIDTVIIDDGFQQWKIAKDLEIVAVNALMPFGNRQMIPRGILREPLSSLKRAGVFVITKANLVEDTHKIREELRRINPEAEIFESAHLPESIYRLGNRQDTVAFEKLKDRKIIAFSGIGDPASFEKLLASQGLKIGHHFVFPDHHNYADKDICGIADISKEKGINTIITTEKDAVRLKKISLPEGLQFLVLKIRLSIENEKAFLSRLLGIYPA